MPLNASKKNPWIGPRDFLHLVQLPVLAAVAWSVPSRHWERASRIAASLHARLAPRRLGVRRQRHQALFGDLLARSLLQSVAKGSLAQTYDARLALLREYRPGGWHPEITIVGKDQIDRALARGRGVVLWVTPFIHSHLVTKKGLHGAGYRVSHLSRPEHNLSSTRFGIRFLNPIGTGIEDRYLSERVRIDGKTDSRSALAILRGHLNENQVVSITVGAQARRTVAVPFLNGTLRLATGPVHLALTSGAVLLPVFTVRTKSGGFVITIDAPLNASDEEHGEDPHDAIVRRYVQRLEPYVLEHPCQSHQALGLE